MARTSGTAPPPDRDSEREIDRLFRLPLDEFVSARNTLAAALRKGGDAASAAAVKDLDKPSVTAWAVNQVWWTDRRAFESMLEAGTRLRDEQRASLQGKAGNMREAVEARQDAIGSVVELAVRAMGGSDRVSPAMRQRIVATCDALATGDVPPDTRLGRLTRDVQPVGFGALSGMFEAAASAAVPAPAREGGRRAATVTPFPSRTAARAASPPASAPPAVETPAERRRREAEDRVRQARDRAARALEEAERVVEAAERTLEARRDEVERAVVAHDAARERVKAAEQELEDARQAESAARIAAAAARREVSGAESDLTRARRAADKIRTPVT
jgi:hypothetical protein